MKITCGAFLLLSVSTQMYAMESGASTISEKSVMIDDASESAALEGAFAHVLTDYALKKSEASSSAPAQESLKPCPQCPPVWQTSLKVLAAGVVGAGLGEGAYRLGLVKSERVGVVTGASIGMSAFGGAGKLKEGVAFVQKYLPKSASKETKEIELKDVGNE